MEIVQDKWKEILQRVRDEHELSEISFTTWIEPLTIHSVEDNLITILVPSEKMGLDYVSKKYTLPIKVAIAEITGVNYEIRFILPEEVKQEKAPAPVQKNLYVPNLNPKYTFDTFVVGSNNKFAHAASLAVAESPGEIYNPLFLYGNSGLGKTHLLYAIGNEIKKNSPEKTICYIKGDDFTNELIESLRMARMSEFRKKYRQADILLVDDVQFIIGKESTQEEFFHTFNALHSAGKQIILTSDKPPKDMETLEDRIRSRFEWGLIADIGTPDYETRMAILRRKVEADDMKLSDEILNYIATNIKSNIRELEGALNKLLAYSNLEKTDITMEIAMKELQNIITPDKPREITPQLVIEVVTEHFNISLDQMISKNRSNEIARPRQIAMYLCKNMTDIPLDSIGQLLGGRDHSTIIHGIKKIADEYESNENTRNLIETIKKKINPN